MLEHCFCSSSMFFFYVVYLWCLWFAFLDCIAARSASTFTSTRQQVAAMCHVLFWWTSSQVHWPLQSWSMIQDVFSKYISADVGQWLSAAHSHMSDVGIEWNWCLIGVTSANILGNQNPNKLWGFCVAVLIASDRQMLLQAPWIAFVPDLSANCSARTTSCSGRQVLEIIGRRPGLQHFCIASSCFHGTQTFSGSWNQSETKWVNANKSWNLSGSLYGRRWVDWLCAGCGPKRSWGLWLLTGIPTLPLSWRRHWRWHGNIVDLQSARRISRSHHGNIFRDSISKGVRHSGGTIQCTLHLLSKTFGLLSDFALEDLRDALSQKNG